VTDNTRRSLTATATALFLIAAIVYGIGVYFVVTRLCKHIGPDIAMLAVAICVFACGVVASRAMVVRSVRAWLACVGALLVTAVLYFFVGVMSLPGCSGV
jgi:hypothetical protein